jgi:hypothetical protein
MDLERKDAAGVISLSFLVCLALDVGHFALIGPQAAWNTLCPTHHRRLP